LEGDAVVVKYAGMAIGIGLLVAALTFAVAAFVVDPTNYVLLVPAGLFLLVGLIALSAGIELAGAAISEPRFAKHGTGLAATATVLAVRDTNMTVTTSVAGPDAPVYEFHLRVARYSAEPYEVQHTQSVPRLGLGAVLPGSAFDVLVDPTDHASLFIDWPATLGVGVVPVQSVPRGRKRRLRVPELASELLVTGAPATATVESFRSLGTVGGLGITPTDPADPAMLGHAG
jgi:hypothetical protein